MEPLAGKNYKVVPTAAVMDLIEHGLNGSGSSLSPWGGVLTECDRGLESNHSLWLGWQLCNSCSSRSIQGLLQIRIFLGSLGLSSLSLSSSLVFIMPTAVLTCCQSVCLRFTELAPIKVEARLGMTDLGSGVTLFVGLI